MLICALKPHAAEKPRPQIEGRKNADADDERPQPGAREIADGERSHIDHRPGEGEAAHDEAKARVTGDPGANGDCLRARLTLGELSQVISLAEGDPVVPEDIV